MFTARTSRGEGLPNVLCAWSHDSPASVVIGLGLLRPHREQASPGYRVRGSTLPYDRDHRNGHIASIQARRAASRTLHQPNPAIAGAM
jgi:hypothetical protein